MARGLRIARAPCLCPVRSRPSVSRKWASSLSSFARWRALAQTTCTRSLRHVGAQVRLALAAQSLLGPVVAETKCAVAFAAAGHQHAVGAVAQRIFDERRRQLAAADQTERCRIGSFPGVHIDRLVAADQDDLGSSCKTRELLVELCAQRIDRELRHVDAAHQRSRRCETALTTGMRRRRCRSSRTNPNRPRPESARGCAGLSQLHGDGGIGTIGDAALAAIAVGRIDLSDRLPVTALPPRQGDQRHCRCQRRAPTTLAGEVAYINACGAR